MAGLDVRGLSVSLFTRGGVLPALSQVSLSVQPGRTLALVGESGCGKSMTALAIMRLLPEPPARIIAGQVMLGDTDLDAQRHLRGALGGLVAGVAGTGQLFVSGGAEHQGPEGGGLIAVFGE